ncbi:MAG: hypothetical protein ACK5MU_02135 [Candidatus Saccharimonadales bacterium]
MPFIRKFRTGSGATGVQVCWKQGGEVVKTVHVGSANSDVALKKLLREAERIKLGEGQSPMFDLGTFEAADAKIDGADQPI